MTIQTNRLTLQPFTADDADFIVELLNSEGFIKHIGDKGVKTREEALAYIENGPGASYRDWGYGLYRISITATGDVIGMCGLVNRPQLDNVDIGYAFLPAYWGQGYALEAAQAIMQQAATLDVGPVVAIVNHDNLPSIALLEKLGLRYAQDWQMSPGDKPLALYR
ncbi:GNAT family N-acetyltransferase [Shewanella sp. GXUN23E]|uniref:GNAT family N-acetyltransferase n=1 Tax=Shewanella sp. GXUN23E TaxID=3422498 RepID=UPI003D7CADFB